jgi:PAS domain S-box-containing protein
MLSPQFLQDLSLVESLGVGVAVVAADGRQTYVNPAFCKMVGYSPAELLNATPPYVYWPPEELPRIEAAFRATLDGGAPEGGVELRFRDKNERRFDVLVKVTPLKGNATGSWVAAVTGITPHARSHRGQSLLVEAGRVLGVSLNYQDTLRSLAHLCVPALADYCLIDLLNEDGEIQRVEIAHRDQRRVGELWEMYRRWPAQLSDHTGIGYVLRERKPILASVVPDEMLAGFTTEPDRLRMLRGMELKSCIIVPMIARDRVLGAITLNSSSSERIFAESDLAMAIALAERAALAVDNARLFQELQTQILGRANLEADLGLALTAGGFGYWTYDVVSGEVYWDRRYREIFGLSATADPTFDAGIAAVHPQDRQRVVDAITEAASHGTDYIAEFRVSLREDVHWIMARGRAFRGANGEIIRMAGFVLDITERVRNEDRWREISSRLDLALSHSGLGDWSWDAATDLVTMSQRAADTFGIPVEPRITWTEMRSLLHPADAEMAAAAVINALANHSEYRVEYRVRNPHDGYRWVEARGRGLYDQGAAVGMIGIVQDVTERRRANDAANILAQAGPALASLQPETILQGLVDLCAGTIGDYAVAYIVREDGQIDGVASAHAIADMQPVVAELARVARPDPDATHLVAQAAVTGQPVFIKRATTEFIQATALNSRHVELLSILRPTGAIAVPLLARGRAVAVLVVVRVENGLELFGDDDVAVIAELADRAALAVDNATLYQQAQQANSVKAQFLATISHELRTPLNAIVGYTELLEVGIAGSITPAQTDFLKRIKASAGHQLNLVEDVLTFATLEAGRPTLRYEMVDIAQLLSEVESILAPAAAQKSLEISISCPVGMNTDTDRAKLRQILLNIVGNAVKFTPAGEIRITAAQEDVRLTIEVTDQGIGIPLEMHETVFKPFFQVDQSRTRQIGGAGLGLSITQRLVDLLGGSINLASMPGVGTTFTITIPSLR